jgi:hypothetical protein
MSLFFIINSKTGKLAMLLQKKVVFLHLEKEQ